jgi:hypothetical protein
MDGFEKYSEIFIKRAKELLEEEELKNNPEYLEVFENNLLGINGPKQLTRKQTPSEIFFSKLYSGFREISDSYYCLQDIEIYIGRFPYANTRVSKTRHLAYHMENYLNEMYLLKERLNSYFTIIGRLYKKDERHQDILKHIKPLFKLVKKSFKGIINIRGAHVHKTRFSDVDLDRLSSQEFITNHGGEEFKIIWNLFKFDYSVTRKKYKQTIKSNNEQIKKLLDACFDILFEIVADNKGQIKYPDPKKA